MFPQQYKYKFDNFLLSPQEGILLQNNEIVPINGRAFNVLLLLVKNQGRVIQKQEFLDTVWKDSFVEEGSLAVAVNALRKILNAQKDSKAIIETFPRRGYRLMCEVEKILIEDENSNNAATSPLINESFSLPGISTKTQNNESLKKKGLIKNLFAERISFFKK